MNKNQFDLNQLNEIKDEFKINHASRMEELNKAIKKTQKSKPSETKNSQKFKAMADLLASL